MLNRPIVRQRFAPASRRSVKRKCSPPGRLALARQSSLTLSITPPTTVGARFALTHLCRAGTLSLAFECRVEVARRGTSEYERSHHGAASSTVHGARYCT